MPTISEFFGILILMYYNDHAPPHFHARYAEHEALIRIDPLGILQGHLPPKALSLVMEWAALSARIIERLEACRKSSKIRKNCTS